MTDQQTPDAIYLQVDPENEQEMGAPEWPGSANVSWCRDRVFGTDIKYRRVVTQPPPDIDALVSQLRLVCTNQLGHKWEDFNWDCYTQKAAYTIEAQQARIAELEGAISRLLDDYAQHQRSCEVLRSLSNACTCGFSEFEAALGGTQ